MPADIRTRRYVEVFGGAGTVLLNKPPSVEEVYNDVNGYLVNLFRWVQRDPDALTKKLEYVLNSRAEFQAAYERLYSKDYPESLLQAAADFYQIHVQSWCGNGKHYGANFRSIRAGFPILEQAFLRLQRVVVEQWDFEKLLRVYACPNGFYYMDPPYVETERIYNGGEFFSREDHYRIGEIALALPGKWMISYNLHPLVMDIFQKPGIFIEHLTRPNSMAHHQEGGAVYDEVIITNYDTSSEENAPSGQLRLADYSTTQRREYLWPK